MHTKTALPTDLMTTAIQRLCLLLLVVTASLVWGEESGRVNPEVRAVLFYSPDSSQYQDLFAFFLPGLLERYGERVAVSAIDASQSDGAAAYRAAASRYKLSAPWDGTPVVLVSEKPVVGLMEIANVLGDDFETLVRVPGAADWPSLPELAPLIAAGTLDFDQRTAREAAPAVPEGPELVAPDGRQFAGVLALAVLVATALALIHSLMRLRQRASHPGPIPRLLLPVTLLIGLGISGYTAYTALADVAPMCGPSAGCGEVQDSEYAKLLGIPMGVLGLLGYGAILVSWFLARRLSPQGGGWRWIPWAIALFAALFSLRLTALGYFVIGASCLWCLGSAVSISLVLWLLSGDTRVRESPSQS